MTQRHKINHGRSTADKGNEGQQKAQEYTCVLLTIIILICNGKFNCEF